MSKENEAIKRWVEVFDGNWHDEPVDSEWADRAHQALAEMRQAIAEAEQPAPVQGSVGEGAMSTWLESGAPESFQNVTLKDLKIALAYFAVPQPAQQEPVAWNVIDPLGKVVATETNAVRGWARIDGYKPTVEGLLGFHEKGWRVVPTAPQPPAQPLTDKQREEIAKCGAEQPAQQAPDYAWPTIADYEKEVGFEVNIAFRSAWAVARTTNDLFKQMGSDT